MSVCRDGRGSHPAAKPRAARVPEPVGRGWAERPRGGRVSGGRCAGSPACLAQVWDTAAALNRSAEPSLQSLERQLAARPEPLRAVQRLQGLLDSLLDYTAAIPFWRNPAMSLEALAEQVDLYDWYRYGALLTGHPAWPAAPGLGLSPNGQLTASTQCPRFYGSEGPGLQQPLEGLIPAPTAQNRPWVPLRVPSYLPQLCRPESRYLPCPSTCTTPPQPPGAHTPVPAGGWATWACFCSTWPSACWCWSASSAVPRASWLGESVSWPPPPPLVGQAQGSRGAEPHLCSGSWPSGLQPAGWCDPRRPPSTPSPGVLTGSRCPKGLPAGGPGPGHQLGCPGRGAGCVCGEWQPGRVSASAGPVMGWGGASALTPPHSHGGPRGGPCPGAHSRSLPPLLPPSKGYLRSESRPWGLRLHP